MKRQASHDGRQARPEDHGDRTGASGGEGVLTVIILAVAFVLEGISLTQAFRQAKKAGRERGTTTVWSVSTT